MTHQTNDPLEFAIQTAKRAGDTLVEHYKNKIINTELKADHSLVTQADIETDRWIGEKIREHFPQDRLFSEELNHEMTSVSASEGLWVVDPIDGTTNFALGLSVWGVLIARLEKGMPQLGAMYFPLIDEMYTARKGGGAFLNGKPIHVHPPTPEQPYSFFACCSRTFRHYDVQIRYKARIMGSAAYSFCCLARGIAAIAFESTPKIWDIAGPWLLVTEAGGSITSLDGLSPFPVQPGRDHVRQNFPTLAAASASLLKKAKSQIKPKAASTNKK